MGRPPNGYRPFGSQIACVTSTSTSFVALRTSVPSRSIVITSPRPDPPAATNETRVPSALKSGDPSYRFGVSVMRLWLDPSFVYRYRS